jgi:hypothetical protein
LRWRRSRLTAIDQPSRLPWLERPTLTQWSEDQALLVGTYVGEHPDADGWSIEATLYGGFDKNVPADRMIATAGVICAAYSLMRKT